MDAHCPALEDQALEQAPESWRRDVEMLILRVEPDDRSSGFMAWQLLFTYDYSVNM